MNNYDFPIVKKGYDPEEVDTIIEELNSRISYLQEQNFKLQAKLSEAQDMIDRYSETEKDLRVSIADSKRAAAEMLSDARDRSAALIDSTRSESCKIIDELDAQIAERYKTIENIKNNVVSFKNKLFDLYASHIEDIEAFGALAENFAHAPDFTQLSLAIDKFEEPGEPQLPEVPQFPEMPEESFFEDAHKLEPEEFNLSDDALLAIAAEAALAADVPETEFTVEEFQADEADKEVLDGTAQDNIFVMKDFGGIFSEVMEDEFAGEDDETADLSILDGVPGIDEEFYVEEMPEDDMFADANESEEGAEDDIIDDDDEMFSEVTKEDEEYFKFLNDFINED